MHNTTIAQQYLEAAYNKDIEKAKSYLSDDITLLMGGNNKLAGSYVGKDQFFATFGKMLEMTNFTYHLQEQVEWLEGKNRTLLLAIEEAERNGKKFEFKRAIDYQIQEDKIATVTIYEAAPQVVDQLFS